jgi:hypothetical protein
MSRKYLSIVVIIVLMLVAVSACAESDLPTGTFSVEVGSYKMEFTEDGEGIRYEYGSLISQGTFSVRADEFTWKSHTFCGDKKAIYMDL